MEKSLVEILQEQHNPVLNDFAAVLKRIDAEIEKLEKGGKKNG